MKQRLYLSFENKYYKKISFSENLGFIDKMILEYIINNELFQF